MTEHQINLLLESLNAIAFELRRIAECAEAEYVAAKGRT